MTGVLKVDDIQDAGANSIVSSNGSGTLTFGSFSAPNITASTAILPDASDGAAIGSASLEWSDIFLADGAVINLGDDQDVTLTHVADTGITLNSTNKLMFNDASQFIQGSSATVLSIGATDEIDLTATAVDLNGTLNVSGVATFQATPVFPDGSLALADLDIDGGTDIGAAIVDADLFIVDDGAGGTNRKVTASRIKTYAGFTATTITGTTALAVQPAADDEIIISDAGTLKRLDIKHIQATPAFAAQTSSSTATAHNTYTKVQCDSEILDSDGTYDNSTNYRFTPGVAGKYFIFGMVAQGSGTGVNNMERQYTAIYKNGSKVIQSVHDGRNNAFGDTFSGTCTIILDLDADDYVELYTKPLDGGSANCNYYTDSTCFGGYRIAGV